MTVEEVAAELGVSKSYAYMIVKQLNDELQKQFYKNIKFFCLSSSCYLKLLMLY